MGQTNKLNENKKQRKIYNFLINCFLILFIMFPMLIIFDNTKYILFSTIFVGVVLIIVNWKKINILENKRTILIISLITLIIRLIYVIKINNNITQVSDFMRVFKIATTLDLNSSYYQTAYHYIFYTYFNGLVYKIFGAHQIVTMILNAIVLSSIPYFLFKICQKIFNNNIIGNMSALIFACWPSMILYTAIMTPDHFALFFMCVSIYLVVILFEKLPNFKIKKDWWLLLLIGLNVSLIGFFKNFSPVIIVATLIIFILKILLEKKYIKAFLIAFPIILVTFLISNTIIFSIEEKIIGSEILKNQFIQYAYVGLGYDNKGVYSKERYDEYSKVLQENNFDTKTTNEYMSEKLLNEIKLNYSSYPEIIKNKVMINFKDDSAKMGWVIRSIREQGKSNYIVNLINSIVIPINESYYILIMLFTLLASIYNVCYLKNNNILFINIVIFGCCLLLMFVEAQGRYRYAMEPLLCIMSAIGIYYGFDIFKNIFSKRNEN